MTVLFCDLVGFTTASDQADPEDIRARLRPYHARVRQDIERYGGTVEKFIGDAVMAVFGAPVAHEDDAERAVRSALRIIESIEELNVAGPGLGLQVRIGVNTGEAVVALGARPELGEGIVTGDVVNTASRLQGVAPVGGIVVGESTYRATQAVFDYQELPPVEVKGKVEALPIWRPLAARARFGTDITRIHTTPLVGRQIDLGILTGAFQKAIQESSAQLVTIVGEPGVGKSRLLAELFTYIDALPEPVRWRQGRCLPYGEGVTFWALGEIVKAEAGILESDSPEIAAAKLDNVVPQGPDREWLRQRLLPLIGLEASSTGEREELFAAWRRFLEALAEQGPTVYVFEDLQWGDEAMLGFVEHLADWSEGVPMFLAGTARPELYEKRPAWAGGKRNSTTINLSPLSDIETARLISLLLDQAVLPAEVQSNIVERAGGNPLYAEEFVRLLRDRELLVRKNGNFVLAPGAEIPSPEGVQALIAARLDTLTPDRKALLQDAAVIGKVFWAQAVAAMGQRDPKSVIEALHELSRKELVRPARVSSMAGEAEYAFWHILVRDVAYAQIPRPQRVEKHRRAAAWIEAVAGERVEDHAEILAYHYTTALDLARAAGQTEVAALQGSALRFLLLAGERALGLDTTRAEASLARALELAAPGHPERPSVLLRWAEAARQAGRHDDAAAALEEAIAGFREQGNSIGSARAMTTLANVFWFMGDRRYREVAGGAVTLLESMPPGPGLVAAYAEKTRLHALGGENREAVESAQRTMALASDLGLEEPAKALGYRGSARSALGDHGGLDDLRRALALAIERGQGREAAILYNNLGARLWVIEGPADSLAVVREGIEFAQRRGNAEQSLDMAVSSLDALFALGSWDEVLESARTLGSRLEASRMVMSLIDLRRMQALVLVLRGQAAEALPLADWAARAAEDSGALEYMVVCSAIAALAHHEAGDGDGSLALLSELERRPHAREAASYASILPQAVRTAVAAGDVALAERLLSGVEPADPYREHALAASRAIIAEARGETDEAARLYAEAAERWERFGVVPERAFALLGQGRCLVALGQTGAATAPLQQAREIFASLGAKPAVAETYALLERMPAHASTWQPDDQRRRQEEGPPVTSTEKQGMPPE